MLQENPEQRLRGKTHICWFIQQTSPTAQGGHRTPSRQLVSFLLLYLYLQRLCLAPWLSLSLLPLQGPGHQPECLPHGASWQGGDDRDSPPLPTPNLQTQRLQKHCCSAGALSKPSCQRTSEAKDKSHHNVANWTFQLGSIILSWNLTNLGLQKKKRKSCQQPEIRPLSRGCLWGCSGQRQQEILGFQGGGTAQLVSVPQVVSSCW